VKKAVELLVLITAIAPLLPLFFFYSRCSDFWFHGSEAYNVGLGLLFATAGFSVCCPLMVLAFVIVRRDKFAILCFATSAILALLVGGCFYFDPEHLMRGFMAD
jgi:hypothetical protein